MNHILQCIRDNIGSEHCSQSCSRDGCRVDLKGTPLSRVIADVDYASLDTSFPGRRCDFILFFQNSDGTVVVVPLELKHGKPEANIAAEQLQAGAYFAERMIPKACCPVCQPILVHGGRLHLIQRKALNRAKIHFRGAQLTIRTAKCGQPGNLATALSGGLGQSQDKRKRKVKPG